MYHIKVPDAEGREVEVEVTKEVYELFEDERKQGDTGHAELDMITKVYAHILDEDRKVNAQKFETSFYANPDLRGVKAPGGPRTQDSVLDLAALVEQLQKDPKLASTLASLLTKRNV